MTPLEFVPAEAFPPGEYLADEMAARGWTARDVSERTGLGVERVEAIVSGAHLLIREAEALRRATGVSALCWMNLQMTYNRWRKARAT